MSVTRLALQHTSLILNWSISVMNEAAQTFISLPEAADVDSASEDMDRLEGYSTSVKHFGMLWPFYIDGNRYRVFACGLNKLSLYSIKVH